MLYSISIKNVALIDNASITLTDGFNVITGETGAGKSILVDSLSLLLGERTDRELVRTGTDSAEIEGVFYVADAVAAKVEERLDAALDDGMLIVRRVITKDGRSTIKANGRTVTLSTLKDAMSYLVDIYGQHEHQALLKKENHIDFLDNYAYKAVLQPKASCGEAFEEYQSLKKQLEFNWGDPAQRERRVDMLKYQIEEIENAQLEDGEEEDLLKRKKILLNAEYIMQTLQQVHYALSGDGGGCEALSVSAKSLDALSDKDAYYASLAERLQSISYEAEDIAAEVSSAMDAMEDSDSLELVEDRLQLIRDLKRKYGGSIAEILQFMESAKNELDKLENASATIEKLEKQQQKALQKLHEACLELSDKRREAAKSLEKELAEQLAQLGMKSAVFTVQFAPEPQISNSTAYTTNGFDEVEFMFSANLGEPQKPLVKVISGGEMSRFMLAVKSIMADNDNIGTMVFDEIDTGISGKMAQVTAEKMAQIAKKHQVLCVTHLPQIAATANTHFFIEKSENGGQTRTSLTLLNDEDRVREIARLSGGECTEAALAHAREMLSRAKIG